MPKNDNPHSVRLFKSIEKNVGGEAAERFAEANPLSKSADEEKKFAWAMAACAHLAGEFDGETVKRIRLDCACGPSEGRIAALRKIYESSDGLADFAKRVNAKKLGFTLETEGAGMLQTYPRCYCSCVKRVPAPLPEAWCWCTLGYTKRMFDCVFGRETAVELVTSVKTGGDKCVIRVI